MNYVLTNNPKVKQLLEGQIEVKYFDVSLYEIIKRTRDAIHKGDELLTHPLSSSIKPNETPYKSVVLKEGNLVCLDSVKIIEESIQVAEKFLNDFVTPDWTEKVLDDFQTIDLSVLENALQNMLF